jgi:N-acetylmuramoyl-L-alanine amidase
VLIRDGDVFVPLGNRFEKAREQKADLFVSIHADAAVNRKARGSSVFMLSTRGATNEAARYLAERENRSDLVGGVSLNGRDSMLAAVLLDLSQGASLEASAQAAEHVLASLTRMGKAHKHNVERANFVVLRSPDVPSVLIETGFISNPDDAILLGLRDYFHSSPPPGTWIAANVKSRAHVVAYGETLTEIAVRHGVSVTQIRQANELETDRVRVGEVLKIPTSS